MTLLVSTYFSLKIIASDLSYSSLLSLIFFVFFFIINVNFLFHFRICLLIINLFTYITFFIVWCISVIYLILLIYVFTWLNNQLILLGSWNFLVLKVALNKIFIANALLTEIVRILAEAFRKLIWNELFLIIYWINTQSLCRWCCDQTNFPVAFSRHLCKLFISRIIVIIFINFYLLISSFILLNDFILIFRFAVTELFKEFTIFLISNKALF